MSKNRHGKGSCQHCDKEMREDNVRRHELKCKMNPLIMDKDTERKQYPGRQFFLTFNEQVKVIAPAMDAIEEIVQFIICDENGSAQEPNPHSHAVVVLDTEHKMTFDEFKVFWVDTYELPEYNDISAVRNLKQSTRYCSKEDYECHVKAIDYDYLSLIKLAWCHAQKTVKLWPESYPYCRLISGQQKQFREFYDRFKQIQSKEEAKAEFEGCELKDWQRLAIAQLQIQTERGILWICDTVGNTGKTWLAKYLQYHLDCIIMENGGKKDLAHAYDGSPVVVFDYTRSVQEQINYGFIENLKNGFCFSAKYESCVKRFPSAKVLCLANFSPELEKLSADRWQIWDLNVDGTITLRQ